MDRVRDSARDLVLWIEDVVAGLSVVDWVLLAIAAAALLWVWLSVRATSRLGPVEVELLVHDGPEERKGEVQALTAILRERLANSGLSPPPAVPAGAPQTDLIAAIEASDVPQARWIAKLLGIVPWPQPVAFKLSGTLHGPASSAGSQVARSVSVWLRPTTNGRELLETVPGVQHEDAVRCAADRIFMHISSEAMTVFPTWARWTDQGALRCYLEALKALRENCHDDARGRLERACQAEPRNLLPRLQLTNIDEGKLDPIIPGEKLQDVAKHADVLRGYLDLAVARPDFVEPRFRASVLASTLATVCGGRIEGDDAAIAARLGLPADDLPNALRRLSARESEAALQLTRLWYVPLRQFRLRHRYEPTGYERRLMKRGLAISSHCVGVRSLVGESKTWWAAWWAAIRLWCRRALVWLYHLQLGRASTGWQAHYNAACFYALLHQRERMLEGGAHGGPIGWLFRPDPAETRRRAFQRAAYRHLNRAIEEGSEVPGDWLEKNDPDLASVRIEGEEGWELVKARHRGQPDYGQWQPDRPWGSPSTRRDWWVVGMGFAALATAGSIAVTLSVSEWWPLIVLSAAAAVLALWRWRRATREVAVKDADR
jgi:hypothetical protein